MSHFFVFFFSNCLFFFSLLFCGEDLKSEYTFCFLKNNLHVSILSVNLTECSQSWHVVFSSRSKLIKVENFEAYFKKQQADSNCGFAEEYEVCGCWMLSLYLLYVFPESWENCFCFMVKLWVRGSLFEGREKVFFLAMLHGPQDLRSPIRDWTHASCSGSAGVLTMGLPGKFPASIFMCLPYVSLSQCLFSS